MDNNKDHIKINIEKLNVFYGDKQAVYDVNLKINNKKVTSLIGPSGCGKSTILKCINRMNDFVEYSTIKGKIFIDDEDIYKVYNEENVNLLRARVGMVFQKPNPFPKSIFENIAYGIKIHQLHDSHTDLKNRVDESLDKAGLLKEVYNRQHESAFNLSGGQQQRLCIARAIAVKPTILLMDEPCSALDPIATAKIEELIDELKTNYTIVIVTHSMQQAARVSEETAFFHLGELIESGITQKIFTNPTLKKTQDYITGRVG